MEKSHYKYIDTKNYDRIFAVSDIHGEYSYLEQALIKARFSKNDILIICGDIVDKGKSSTDTLNYVIKLSEEYSVHAVLGNRDYMYTLMLSEREKDIDFFLSYAKENQNSLFNEMCDKCKTEVKFSPETVKKLALMYKRGIGFLASLPVILETNDFYFVHAGLKDENLQEQDMETCLTMCDFASVDHMFSKYCIVGHTPVCNLHKDGSFLPYIDAKRKKLFIDGGLATVKNGRLNLLYLPDNNAENYELIYV